MRHICRNSLPTRVWLSDKGVDCPQNCVLCDNSVEDTAHVFFLCQNSEQCWDRFGLWNLIQQKISHTQSVVELVFSVLQSLSKEYTALFMVIIWSIWRQWNNKIWNKEVETQAADREWAITLITNWSNAQKISGSNSTAGSSAHQSTTSALSWKKPQAGRYKCSVDAAFTKNHNKVGIGFASETIKVVSFLLK